MEVPYACYCYFDKRCLSDYAAIEMIGKTPFFSDGDGSDQGYINVRDATDGFCVTARRFTEELWDRFSHLADSQFLAEAKDNYTERFWEMYLGCTLLDRNLKPGSPGDSGPDLYAAVGRKRIWFEATAPSAGAGADKVPQAREGRVSPVPEKQIILRLTGAVSAKKVQFQNAIDNGIATSQDGFVVCINGRNIPSNISDHIPERIVKAFFPIGNQVVTVNRDSGEIVNTSYQLRTSVRKKSGIEIDTTGFLSEDLREISAVIYSTVDAANSPERLGDDFVCVHNPNASVRMKVGTIRRGVEYVALGEYLHRLDYTTARGALDTVGFWLRLCWTRTRYTLEYLLAEHRR